MPIIRLATERERNQEINIPCTSEGTVLNRTVRTLENTMSNRISNNVPFRILNK